MLRQTDRQFKVIFMTEDFGVIIAVTIPALSYPGGGGAFAPQDRRWTAAKRIGRLN
jgi:hypothetical protein